MNRFDQLNRMDTQKPSYGDMPIDIWEGGHMYHVIHADLARERLDDLLMMTKLP